MSDELIKTIAASFGEGIAQEARLLLDKDLPLLELVAEAEKNYYDKTLGGLDTAGERQMNSLLEIVDDEAVPKESKDDERNSAKDQPQ